MRGNELLLKMELIAPEYIEAADEMPEKAEAIPFRPWMKWAVAAVLAVVIGVGAPVALNMMGVFRNENFVSPSGGSGNSGIITPIDGSSESGSSEEDSGSIVNEPSNSSAAPSNSSGKPGGSSTETPDVSSSETPIDLPEQPEGNFVKDNMPAVTYKINGEYKTFDYQSSTAIVDSGSSYVVDHYVGSDGSTVSTNAASGGLVRYEAYAATNGGFSPADVISEETAIMLAKQIAFSSELSTSEIEINSVYVQNSYERYYIIFSFTDCNVEICLSDTGQLQYIIVN